MIAFALSLALFAAQEVERSAAGLEVGPNAPLFPAYVADPRRPVVSITQVYFVDESIAEASPRRWGIRMGSRFGLLQWGDPSQAGAVGLDLEVGFLGQFDQDNSADNIGWDGLYAFDFAWRASEDLVLRLGAAHDSAHVGDEYIEATDRRRLAYTREELRLGAAYDLDENWRAYAEGGLGYTLRSDLMEPGRAQFGLEYEATPSLGSGSGGWAFRPYGALDVSAFEEDDWEPNFNAQVGIVHDARGGGRLRFGLELTDGRSTMGEFFQDRETSIALGVWIDP